MEITDPTVMKKQISLSEIGLVILQCDFVAILSFVLSFVLIYCMYITGQF